MRIVIAPNSFKHCLDARAVGDALASGIHQAAPDADTRVLPMADGGDGLLDVLAGAPGTDTRICETVDALGRPLHAVWLKTDRGAVIETARAIGIARLAGPHEYAPLWATSRGVGLLIRAALDAGCRALALGLGGSATTDAGAGLAAALGFRLLDAEGRPLPEGGGALGRLARIVTTEADPRLQETTCVALTDVRNPLLGPTGAARLFAPQKGATPEDVAILERNLAQWSAIAEHDVGWTPAETPGAGAAGGLGAGCALYLRAALTSGAAWVADFHRLEAAIAAADYVLTGEGRLDAQTALGKAPAHVARLARAHGKPVIAFGGAVAPDLDPAQVGFDACIAVSPPECPAAEALRRAPEFLARAAATWMRSLL